MDCKLCENKGCQNCMDKPVLPGPTITGWDY